MDLKQWSAILSRIGPHDADDLDELLAKFDPRRSAARTRSLPAARGDAYAADATQAGRCRMRRGARHRDERIRFRPRDVPCCVRNRAGCADRSTERGDRSGLERFGFRVERLSGDSPERAPPARTRSAGSGIWTFSFERPGDARSGLSEARSVTAHRATGGIIEDAPSEVSLGVERAADSI